MKTLYLIGGTMGVGKTTVCRELKNMLPNSVFLDGDWCWDMHPFRVNEETKAMVMENICALLNNFLKCSQLENVIFCWVMHEQSILDEILSRLAPGAWSAVAVSLICSEPELCARLQKDIAAGIRTETVLERSIGRLPMYDGMETIKIDTSERAVKEIAEQIAGLC